MIPKMTHPLSTAWTQPARKQIQLRNGVAHMTWKTFSSLLEYSTSTPSGVYEGKMWKRQEHTGRWFLCWYDPSPTDPAKCSVRECEIVIQRTGRMIEHQHTAKAHIIIQTSCADAAKTALMVEQHLNALGPITFDDEKAHLRFHIQAAKHNCCDEH